MSQTAPGSEIKLGILRDGKPETLNLKVGEYKGEKQVAENEGDGAQQHGKLGLAVGDLTPDVRQQLNIPSNVQGAAVAECSAGEPGGRCRPCTGRRDPGSEPQAGQERAECTNDVHAVPAGKDILLLVWSHGGASYRVVHPAEGKQSGE